MSDSTTVKIISNTPEEVAFKLLDKVGMMEDKWDSYGNLKSGLDRKWLLDAYAECLDAVKDHRQLT